MTVPLSIVSKLSFNLSGKQTVTNNWLFTTMWFLNGKNVNKVQQSKSPANIYLFKINIGNTRIMYEICSKLAIKTPERRQWRRSGVFMINFEQVSLFFGVSIIDFEQINACWDTTFLKTSKNFSKIINAHKNFNKCWQSNFMNERVAPISAKYLRCTMKWQEFITIIRFNICSLSVT